MVHAGPRDPEGQSFQPPEARGCWQAIRSDMARSKGVARGPKTSSKWGQLDVEMTAVVWLDFRVSQVSRSPQVKGMVAKHVTDIVCPQLHHKQVVVTQL